MRKFKIRPSRYYEPHEITEENVKQFIPFSEKEKYLIDTPQGKRYSAVCPYCDNPIRLFGIGKIIKRNNADGSTTIVHPFGKHLEMSTQIAEYNERQYQRCVAAGHFRQANKEDIWETPSPLNIEIYYSVRENFDTAIYILSKSIGVWLSDGDSEAILKSYLSLQGYQHYDASYYNIPWMLLYASTATIKLWGKRIISDTKLHKILSKEKKVKLVPHIPKGEKEPDFLIVENNGEYYDGAIDFGVHKKRIDDEDNVIESFELRYNSNGKTIIVEKIVIDTDWYEKIVHSQNRIRNEKRLALAQKLMPDISENQEG